MKRTEVVSAVVVKEGKVLAAKRLPGQTFEGLWRLPGGKLEPGESIFEAIIRELEEEMSGFSRKDFQPASFEDFSLATLEVKYAFGSYRVYFVQVAPQYFDTKEGIVEWMDGQQLEASRHAWIPGDWHVASLALYQAAHS